MSALFEVGELQPPTGHAERFGGRWRLVLVGLSDVWRYGDLILPAASGRLLLRGPNGTGKTTALEALWPYLLDLNALKLSAGKARTTSLRSLMRDGASGKLRVGYLWLTFAGPGDEGEWSYGTRLQYSESTPVKVVPFVVPGRPLRELDLRGPDRASLNLDEFSARVEDAGGQVFDEEDAYRANLAARVWAATPLQVGDLAARLRVLRNPSLLGDLSAAQAADALREALPTVGHDVIGATADALAESDATRDAFARDATAAQVLGEFAEAWAGHVTAIVGEAHAAAVASQGEVTRARDELKRLEGEAEQAQDRAKDAYFNAETVREALRDARAEREALAKSEAYRAAGALAGLRETVTAKQRLANAQQEGLHRAATAERARSVGMADNLTELAQDLHDLVGGVSTVEPAVAPDQPLLTWTVHQRATITLGDMHVDPGFGISTAVDLVQLRGWGQRWADAADSHRTRASDAHIALSDHERDVVPVKEEHERADRVSRDAQADADKAQQQHQRLSSDARTAATALRGGLVAWAADHRSAPLMEPSGQYAADIEADREQTVWTASDVADLADAEPGQVLERARAWGELARWRALREQAALILLAKAGREDADRLEREAGDKRALAAQLRSGTLLPLPRPAWVQQLDDDRQVRSGTDGAEPGAGVGDEKELLGSALDWATGSTSDDEQALVESALAASGLLGATMDTSGAHTLDWTVSPIGPQPETPATLASILTVDEDHPQAAVARAVLERVPLLPTADAAPPAVGLVVGRDGSFAAGPVHGRAPGVRDTRELPPAAHIGARQRRDAALKQAHVLELDADGLDTAAGKLRDGARRQNRQADEIGSIGASFPTLRPLEAAESGRSHAARLLHGAREEAERAARRARETERLAADARGAWADRTRGRGLPTTTDELQAVQRAAAAAAEALGSSSAQLLRRLLPRAARLGLPEQSLADREIVELLPADLSGLIASARSAHDGAASAQVEYETLDRTQGTAAKEAVRQHAEAEGRVTDLDKRDEPARREASDAAAALAAWEARVEAAQGKVVAAQPAADAARHALATLLRVPGVSQALTPMEADPANSEVGDTRDGARSATDDPVRASNEAEAWWTRDPVEDVGAALSGRRRVKRRLLGERYDEARAALAGVWSLEHADSVGELDTFTLTHDDTSYHPLMAARRAHLLKDRAQAALDAAEESALRDFVVGRLPAAIGVAWTRMHDWARTVNGRMRSAAASSGVGVQVRLRLSDDLSPAARTVYELSCTVADADRTTTQKQAVGAALTQLIAAADEEAMHDRVAGAIDVREWVTLHYEIDRGTGRTERWGSRTALSGGERRLVVLAPMLAAVAAGYDSLGEQCLRLAALDEVPAEVDERGREGLARYIAELDLDLIATSYLWDGAPGAWDGIDAYDLEAGSDGTVVAFPMLIRGLDPLPGDTWAAAEGGPLL